jgi:hypothetical protein
VQCAFAFRFLSSALESGAVGGSRPSLYEVLAQPVAIGILSRCSRTCAFTSMLMDFSGKAACIIHIPLLVIEGVLKHVDGYGVNHSLRQLFHSILVG